MPLVHDSDPVRVLYLIGGRRIGGMETHLLTLASALPASTRCMVCCIDASDDYRTRLTTLGIAQTNLGSPRLLRPGMVGAWRALRRLVREFDPHVVHSYGFSADVFAALLRLGRPRVRVITSRRGEERDRRRQAMRRLVNRVSDRVVCVSAEIASFVQSTEAPAARLLEVIPNGVAFPEVTRRPPTYAADRPLRFGTLGTVKPIKGTDLLVDAFLRFAPERRVELVVAGLIDRPWAESLREKAGRDPRIRFIGRTSAPREFLAELDVFVLPSRSEGMSNALLEAMAAGLPCIATDVGSNRSVLCPAGDRPAGMLTETTAESLFQAMATLEAAPEARARFGAQAAALVRARHTIPAMVSHYERLYRAVVGRAGGTRGTGDAEVAQRMTVDA